MSADFKKYMIGLLAFFVVAILMVAVILPAGSKAIKNTADTVGESVSCTLAVCDQQTSHHTK
ncbi:hypothetical protein [Herpetosiphon geysericola]|uniref:Uncharacterized protein n=1 Tax=Herpetosiphon geysericola TaxID=70996 RepID=A0A0P6XCC4_9CHLR|nr:hypothetical protein [Herpetosiphon geysericola]KPL80014.1 hypothetical protein SE18_25880 [Herpetosiphon geysericola]